MINPASIIVIPVDVARCPACEGELIAEFDQWVQWNDGWRIENCYLTCEADDSPSEGEHKKTYDMPYVYWLPETQKAVEWINENYRFDLD